MFNKLIGRLFARANTRRKQRYADARQETTKALRLFRDTLRALVVANDTGRNAIDVLDDEIGWHRLLQAKPEVEAMVRDADPDPLVLAAERYGPMRKYAARFLEMFTFRSSRRHDSLLAAIGILKALNATGRRDLPERVPVGHLSRPSPQADLRDRQSRIAGCTRSRHWRLFGIGCAPATSGLRAVAPSGPWTNNSCRSRPLPP